MFDAYLHLPGNMRPWGDYLKGDHHLLEIDRWWSQVIFVVNRNQVTRRQLALWAAEKDGGAHSDSQLDPGYEVLSKMWTSVTSEGTPTAVPHQHLFALRRFALEVLASDELLKLAWSEVRRPDSKVIAHWPQEWSPVMDRAHDIASTYFTNLPKAEAQRDGKAIGTALELVDEIRMPLSEWHADHLTRSAEYEAALRGYAAIQAIRPDHQHSSYGMGYASHRLNLPVEAESHLRAANSNNPSHIPSLLALANLYLDQDKFDMARPLYETVLDLDHENASAKANLQILELSERALVPEHAVSALLELANVYIALKLHAGAQETFQRVLRIDPANAVAFAESKRLMESSSSKVPRAT